MRTAAQKNNIDRARKTKGRCSQPRPRIIARKPTSIGRVTRSRVSITVRGLGWCESVLLDCEKGRVRAAECRAVERRETKIEPTAPGRPGSGLITCFR